MSAGALAVLLFQNSWEALPIVEVRQDYAAFCRATLEFVTTPQLGVALDDR